jgi:hypothetical protein
VASNQFTLLEVTMSSNILTQEELKSKFHYDKDTGIFTRTITTSTNAKAGNVAGSPQNHGYLTIMINGKNYMCHRLAWLYMMGSFPINTIDHINMIRNDNRFCNLREATITENNWNTRNRRNNKSGYNGVHWSSRNGKWASQITVNLKVIHVGYFECPEEASIAHDAIAKSIRGEFYR